MGIAQIPAPTSGLSAARFEATQNRPFQIPAGLTLQNTITSTTSFSAGQLPAQVFVVMAGGGGGGSRDQGAGGGGGGTCIGWVDVPSTGITATIGAGGAAGTSTSGQYYGQPGGNTSFGGYIAYGGGGGMATNDSWASSGNGPHRQSHPRGPGAGWGGIQLTTMSSPSVIYPLIVGCAPFTFPITTINQAGGNMRMQEMYELYSSNFTGGGAGGTQQAAGTRVGKGGNGLTGGGGTWNGSLSSGDTGGNSSRDGGVTNTFTGGTGNSSGYAGGGAGLLANGGNQTGSASGAGGSGGGGGGGTSSWTLNPGAGGNGCVLIYY